jgi:uncharacterized protein (DUF1697 family)
VTTFVALLRSVNVGGRNRVPMGDLRDLVASFGFGGVATYVQSGNLVLTGAGTGVTVAETIEAGIADAFGLDVPVIVRSRRQVAQILSANPYVGPGADPRTVHVTFLSGPPDAARRRALARTASEAVPGGRFGDDRFELIGSNVYLHCPGGYGETKLNNAYFERATGGVATTRNWRTVTTLAGMAGLGVGAG